MRRVKRRPPARGRREGGTGTPGWAELWRRRGFEVNGPVLQYFGNLASGSRHSPRSEQRHKDSKAGRFSARF
jgi:hypothetical protein